MAPSTPPATGLAEYASDPESAGSRRRARRGAMPATKSGLLMKVGRRGWGTTSGTSTSSSAGAPFDDAAADIGIGARASAAATYDGKGAGGARRPSAGSRLGALLRRGAPSLNHLRSYRGGSGGKPPESKGTADLGLPALGISPPPELEDPPEGQNSFDNSRAGGASAEASCSGMPSSSGRRRFYKSRSSVGGSSRNISGRAQAGAASEDPLDSSGGGARLRRASSYSKFARKKNGKTLDVDDDDQVAFWSGSELAHGGAGSDERRQPSPAFAAANARRDRSAPPSGRVASGIDRYIPAPAEPLGAAPGAGGGAAKAGNHRGRGGGIKPPAVTPPADVRRLFPNDDVCEYSPNSIEGTTCTRAKHKKTRRRIVDGYTSAPEVCSDIVSHGAALEVDECIARAEAALFAIDTTSDAEIGGDCDQEQASLSSDGDGGAALSSRGSSNATGPAAAAASADTFSAPAVAVGGRHATTSKRRRFAELLHFRRRSSSGTGSPGALPPSTSTANGDGGVSYDGGTYQNGNSNAASGTALGVTTEGKASLRRGSTPLVGPPRRKMLHRANSTSALDRVASSGREEEDYPAVSVVGVASRKSAASGRRRVGARRRLLPGGSSAAGLGVSVSPEPHRRHRESFLEAGKDKLRRSRSKLSRGAFGTRSSSQRRARAAVSGDAPREDSSLGGSTGVEKESTVGVREPTKRGPHAKPQLGTTYAKRRESPPLDQDVATPWNTWGRSSASEFNVRTKGYGRTKTKAPSATELYELVSIDVYRSPAARICGVYPMFTPPACIAAEVNASDLRADSTGQAPTPARAAGEPAAAAAKDGTAALSGAAGGNANPAKRPDPVRLGEVEASSQNAGVGTGHPDIPPVLVINCQLPDVPTPFSGQGDGPTVHIIFTFHATRRLRRYAARAWAEETAAPAAVGSADGVAAASETAPSVAHSGGPAASGVGSDAAASGGSSPQGGENPSRAAAGADGDGEAEDKGVPESVRLLAEWMRRAEDDGSFRGRFKVIGDLVNADEVGLPGMLSRFSGKPILVYGRESSVIRGPGFAELDLNAHAFSYVGRKGLYATLDKWKHALFRIGFLLEGRTDEEQPEHILGCAIFHGLDLDNLSELALSPDGERLVVTNAGEKDNAAVSDLSTPALGEQASSTSSSSSSAARNAPPQPLVSSQHSTSRVAASSSSSPPSSLPPSSSRVPLVRRRHVALLLRSHGGGGGRGDVDTPTASAIVAKNAFFGERAVVPRDDDVTVIAVAAAAFAGGWFCALLAMITLACWAELSIAGGRVEGGGGHWPAGLSAWVVRLFADP